MQHYAFANIYKIIYRNVNFWHKYGEISNFDYVFKVPK